MRAQRVLFPHDIEPGSPVGGKARALAAMTQAALPVPAWFVVLPDAFNASLPGGADRRLAAASSAADAQAVLRDVRLLPEIVVQVMPAARSLGADVATFAVRSSALEEDSARFSFAGQFDSFLFVPLALLPDRIVDVWRSAFSDRLLRYRREAGMAAVAGFPAVIVQRMIDGDVSGVAFSADPVSGRRGIAVVAAVPGLGSALVSGEVSADTWRVDRRGAIVERTIVEKRVMHRLDPAHPEGVAAVAVPAPRVGAPALDDDRVREVAALARRAAAHFGRPQDIEWTFDADHLLLLQSRPITTLADQPDPDGVRALWDNSNIIESYSGVTTPLTFSFARRAYENVYREFCRVMGVPEATIAAHAEMFGSMLGLVRGRVYYNLFNWYRLVALLPGYAANRRFLEQMLGVREAPPDDVVVAPASAQSSGKLRHALRLALVVATVAVRILTLPRRMKRFHANLHDALGTAHPDLSALRPEELVRYYRMLEHRLLTHWDTPVINDFATMIFHGLLRRLSSEWLADVDGTLPNDLLCAERGMISEEPARRVREMAKLAAPDAALVHLLCEGTTPAIRAALRERPEFNHAFDTYLERFGDRCMEELKLESATLHDDPLPLLRSIGRSAHNPEPGEEAAATAVRAAAARRVRTALGERPLRRLAFAWIVANARVRLRDRENLRFERTRVFGRARRILVELGRRFVAVDCLEDPRDVFYLELDEVLGFVEGWATTADLKGLAEVRKAEFERYRSAPAPADRFETRGLIHRGHAFGAETTVEPITGEAMRGLGCCPGVVRGPVCLVRDPKNAAVRPGDIIVAEHTDPGWVMIFPSASGLLVERGNLLSHSAIVARELGLPTIVSLPGVTRWLADGEWVQMNGSTGSVTRVAHPRAVES